MTTITNNKITLTDKTSAPAVVGELVRNGNNLYYYDGTTVTQLDATGGVSTLNDVGNVTITTNSSGEIIKWNGSAWVNNTLSEAGIEPTITTLAVTKGGTGVTTKTGTGNVVLSTSPSLTTPALGTPSALVGTNITGTATSFTSSNVTTNANLTGDITSTGNATVIASGVIVNADVNASAGIVLTKLATSTSAQLATLISDETGTGKVVFGTAPTIDSPSLSYAINAQTGTTYTPVLLDAGKIITSSNASAVVITIPPNSSVAYPIGSSLTVISIGVGLTNFAQGSGVTITSTGATPTAPVLRVQHSSATAIKTATDTWRVVGDIS